MRSLFDWFFGEPTMEQERDRLSNFKAQARKEKICLRCLVNSDGLNKNNVKGLDFCKICGMPVWV